MSEAVKNYVKFNVLGVEEDIVSLDDKEKLNRLYKRRDFLSKNTYKTYVLETYSLEDQVKIFNDLKKRQGDKCRITFVNALGFPVEIVKAKKKKSNILLECVFCKTRRKFAMWLDTFLRELYLGNITKVKPDGFYDAYLTSVYQMLKKVNDAIKDIENKYNEVYKETAETLEKEYKAEVSQYQRVKQEAKSQRYQMSSEEALERARAFKGLDRVKTYWNSRITEDEKKELMSWICKNIYSIRVYGLLTGQSGNTLLNEYSDVGNVRYRNPQVNAEGKITSQDSIVAHISFTTLAGAPISTLEKVISTKNRSKDIFYHNRLNDKNLALFLLSEYAHLGFKAGVRNLYKQIKQA